jgi:hypothetical protein
MAGQGADIAPHRFPHHLAAVTGVLDPEHVWQEASELREPGPDLLGRTWRIEAGRIADRDPADRDALPSRDLTADVHRAAQRDAAGCRITAPLKTIAPVAMKTSSSIRQPVR